MAIEDSLEYLEQLKEKALHMSRLHLGIHNDTDVMVLE